MDSVAALQFWTEDLDPQTISSATERVYTTFFYSNFAQNLWQEEEVLFGHFVTTFNDAFEYALTSEDIGYESGSESMSVPHHYIKNHDYFTSPCKKIYLMDLPPQEHTHLPATPMQCTANWLMKKTIHSHLC